MADNVDLDAGSGGATIKTDDDGTAHWQYVKMSFGADNTQTRVTSSVGLPVDLLAGTAEIGNVANSGTFAIQEDGAALTALQVIDNIVHVDDAAFTLGTDSGVMMMGFAGTQSVNTNDAAALACDTDGALHVSDGGNSLTVDGTVTANLSATDNAVLDQIEVNTSYGDNTGGGVESGALRVTIASDSTGLLSIDDNGGSITVDNAGTFATQATCTNAGTFATQATLQTGSNTVGEVTIGAATGATGDLAKTQDVAMGANDVGIAMLAVRDDEQAAMTPVDGDYSTLRTDRFGNLKVTQLPDATSEVKFGVIDAASSGDNTLQAAAGAGIKIRVLSVMMVSAGTVTTRFESGAGGTALTGQMNLVANSGFTLPYNPAGWFETADNTLLNLELSAAISVDGCFTYVEV